MFNFGIVKMSAANRWDDPNLNAVLCIVITQTRGNGCHYCRTITRYAINEPWYVVGILPEPLREALKQNG